MADTTRAASLSQDPSGSAINFAVKEAQGLEYKEDDDDLTTKVYHGVSITSGGEGQNGIIGRIQSWQPDAYTREGVHLYELSDRSWGRPMEYIPGKATGFTIAVQRAEVWYGEMEKAFAGADTWSDLIDQRRPFTIREWWIRGETAYQVWTYRGCWFQSKNYDAITSDGDGVTRVSGTIAYVSHRLTAGDDESFAGV